MSHVLDDLELYALGALPADQAEAVARHLGSCSPCRAAASELADVVALLPDAVPLREPPAALKARILAAAEADAPPARRSFRLPWALPDMRLVAVAASVVLLVGFGADQTLRLRALQAERDQYELTAMDFARGGRTWYMAGVEQWRGMGGNLMQPGSGDPAFVLFHDLRPLSEGQLYTVWLIAPDGKWVRGTSFRPDGRELQLVSVGQELAGFERCAVTVETSASGKREGPIVMQSRIVPSAP